MLFWEVIFLKRYRTVIDFNNRVVDLCYQARSIMASFQRVTPVIQVVGINRTPLLHTEYRYTN